ncbi:MAG TPA: glutamine--fructose-6-phosphate transaminase (isomerizing) [Thermodesulfovibrionales bacterium]|nr:glutamine--fructose-6-phosphate transaminase (isomerizing) [Thermodesulfovibrionales bacterium]
MCGIVGYIGKGNALPILLDSLRRLEYRGYDSAGVACRNGKGIEIYKTRGKIEDLLRILPQPVPDFGIGLGHTRWATHGEPSTQNAHPHSADGVVVVHNGIIENYRDLKSYLLAEGHEFSSDTDTEVIPQLISHHLARGLSPMDAIRETTSMLKGTYALGILCDTYPDTLFAIKCGSPLVVALGEGEFFFASDIPALLPYSRKFIFPDDGQVCTMTKGGIELKSLTSMKTLPIKDSIIGVDWTPSMAEKEGYEHFMLKEIYEQPKAVTDTLSEWIDDPRSLLEELRISDTAKNLRRLHIVGCGSSYHAGLVGRYIIEKFVRLPVNVDIASEYRYMGPIITKGTLFVTITQSGETADTLAAQREAREKGALAFAICNVTGSTATREADSVLYTRAGPEIGVASTKAFTAQMAALCLLGIALGMKKGKLSALEIQTLKSLLMDLPCLIKKALKTDRDLREIAKTLTDAKGFLYLGRGLNYPVALEGALKMKEISYTHAGGYPAGEIKHGPLALVEKGVPVVFLAPMDSLLEKVLSNIEEVRARGGRVIAITDAPAALREKVDELIVVPSTHPAFQPFVTVVPLQLLAYHVAVLKGCNVDQPRNLAKSVTVE